MTSNRGTLLGELRQLVDEIDNNNYVARKVYDYCEKYKFNGETTGDRHSALFKHKVTAKECSAAIMQTIIRETPLMNPHYHMAELFTNLLSLTVEMIDVIRTFLRNFWLNVIGKPMTQSIAIQYDMNSGQVRDSPMLKPRLVQQPIIPDIGESNLFLVLGENGRMKDNTYTMFQGNNKQDNLMCKKYLPDISSINLNTPPTPIASKECSNNSVMSEVTYTQTSVSYLSHEIDTQTSRHTNIKENNIELTESMKPVEIETQTPDFVKSEIHILKPDKSETEMHKFIKSNINFMKPSTENHTRDFIQNHINFMSISREVETNNISSENSFKLDHFDFETDDSSSSFSFMEPVKYESRVDNLKIQDSFQKFLEPVQDDSAQTSKRSKYGLNSVENEVKTTFSLGLLRPRSKLTSLPEL